MAAAAPPAVEDVRAGSAFTVATSNAGAPPSLPPPPAGAFGGNGNGDYDSHAGHMEEMMVGAAASSKVAPAPPSCLPS